MSYSYHLYDLPQTSKLSTNIAHKVFDLLVKYGFEKKGQEKRYEFIYHQSESPDACVDYTTSGMAAQFFNSAKFWVRSFADKKDTNAINKELEVVFTEHCEEVAKKLGPL